MAILNPKGANTAIAASKKSKVSGNASQSEKYAAIVNFFRAKGLSAAGAAGIAGNIMQESGLNPQVNEGGFVQDEYPEYGQGRKGAGAGASAVAQLEAVWSELQSEPSTLEALHKAPTAAAAARVFSEDFEKPGEPDLGNREHYAEEALASIGQGGSLSGVGSTNSAQAGIEAVEQVFGGAGSGVGGVVKTVETDAKAAEAGLSAAEIVGEWLGEPTRILKLVGGAMLLYLGVKTLTAGSPAEGAVQAPAKAVKAVANVVPADRGVKLAKRAASRKPSQKGSTMKPMKPKPKKPKQALDIAKAHGR